MNQINIWKDKSTFLGHFPTADWHKHGSPVLFIGVSGGFQIEFEDGVKEHCSSAVVDAGVAHKTHPNGELMALFYLAPYSLHSMQFRKLFLQNSGYLLDVLKTPTSKKRLEKSLQYFDLECALARKLPSLQSDVDPRVSQSLHLIHDSSIPQNRDDVANRVSLSSSRFNHLFSQKMNVSYRHYRQWIQLGNALTHYQQVRNLTHAALLAGFSDASHFSNTCKRLLGITPSSILNKDTVLNVSR